MAIDSDYSIEPMKDDKTDNVITSKQSLLPSSVVTLLWLVASLTLFIIIWAFIAKFFFNPNIIPGPVAVAREAASLIENGSLWVATAASLRRVYVGLIIGVLAGIILGLSIGTIRYVDRLVDPVVQLMRNLSPTAMIPLAIVWFGIGETSKYFLVVWGSIFFVTVNTAAGVKETPKTRLRMVAALGIPGSVSFFRVLLPSALPYVGAGVRLASASAYMTIVPAELLAAETGIGAMLQQASLFGQTDRMFVALAVIGVLGLASDRIIYILFDRVLKRYTHQSAEL